MQNVPGSILGQVLFLFTDPHLLQLQHVLSDVYASLLKDRVRRLRHEMLCSPQLFLNNIVAKSLLCIMYS